MSKAASISRRRFLRRTIPTVLGAPAILSYAATRSGAAVLPSERIAMGCIGIGGHGTNWNLARVLKEPDGQVLAVCYVF